MTRAGSSPSSRTAASATRRRSRATWTTRTSSARTLLKLAERSAARLRATGQVARTVSIKVRFADFTTITRSRTLKDSTDVGREVYATAKSLYDALGLQRARLRLVGVRLEGLADADRATRQLALDERPVGWREADRAVDAASARFGAGSVRPASLVTEDRHR